jgi:hypothetical protein
VSKPWESLIWASRGHELLQSGVDFSGLSDVFPLALAANMPRLFPVRSSDAVKTPTARAPSEARERRLYHLSAGWPSKTRIRKSRRL